MHSPGLPGLQVTEAHFGVQSIPYADETWCPLDAAITDSWGRNTPYEQLLAAVSLWHVGWCEAGKVGQGAAVAPPVSGDTEENPPHKQSLAGVGVIGEFGWHVHCKKRKKQIVSGEYKEKKKRAYISGPYTRSPHSRSPLSSPVLPCTIPTPS